VNAALPNLVRQELRTAPLTEVRYAATKPDSCRATSSRIRPSFTCSLAGCAIRVAPDVRRTFVGVPFLGTASRIRRFLGRDRTRVSGAPRPADIRSQCGSAVRGKKFTAGVDYDLSLFRNHIGSVIFENPFGTEAGLSPNPVPPPALTCGLRIDPQVHGRTPCLQT